MIETQVTLPDGRHLTYTDIGNPEGHCVLNFHGAPASRNLLTYLDGEFEEYGLRVLSPDRPGFGGSSLQPGRSLADWPVDVADFADVLDIGTFSDLGSSSGGPYAVACCALLPERVTAGLIVAGTTDMSWENAREGYPSLELQIMDLGDEEAATEWCTEQFGSDGSGFFEEDQLDWPEPDEEFLANETKGTHLEKVMTEAFTQGVAGYAQDMIVTGREWPFDPADIHCPVHVAHGDRDDIVPLAHSRHTADVIPTAKLKIVEGHGHASIMDEMPRLTAELIDTTTN